MTKYTETKLFRIFDSKRVQYKDDKGLTQFKTIVFRRDEQIPTLAKVTNKVCACCLEKMICAQGQVADFHGKCRMLGRNRRAKANK